MKLKMGEKLESMDRSVKGGYILEFQISKPIRIEVGKLGKFELKPGWYYYIGSALNGLRGRLLRHFSGEGKIHWHIDYLTRRIKPVRAFRVESGSKLEGEFVGIVEKKCETAIKRFGCSDTTGVITHLFYSKKRCNFLKELKPLGRAGIISNKS